MCGLSSGSAWLSSKESGVHRLLIANTKLSFVVFVLLLLAALAGCTTVTPPAPVTPSVLQEAPPDGDFRMRLEHFFDPKQTGPTN
jgi:hypothetical protein